MIKTLDISQSRKELDQIEKEIIKAFAERKKYPYDPKAHIKSAYLPILKMLCIEGAESEEAKRIDRKIASLVEERISKAREIIAYKKLNNIEIYDKKREKELLKNAEKYSKEYNLGPKIGIKITEIILEKTKEPAMSK